MNTININIPADGGSTKEEHYWALPFNNIIPANDGSIILYLKNTGDTELDLEKISISCTQKPALVQIHHVLGEPEFSREKDINPVSKYLAIDPPVPDIEIKSCADADQLFSQGQLARLDMKDENTTYEMDCDVTISSNSIVVVTVSGNGEFSGVITVSQELED